MFEGYTQQISTPKDEGFWGRFNHPIFGAFAASWLVWNWEIVYLLIRGLPSASDTIKEINERYLTREHLPHLLWIPLSVAIVFLLLGPILKDLYSLYKSKMSAWIGGYETVSKGQYDQVENQKRREQEEKEIFQRVVQSKPPLVDNGKGGTIPLEQLIRNSDYSMQQNQELQSLNDRLKAEILILTEKKSDNRN
jgi:hypothetical protein